MKKGDLNERIRNIEKIAEKFYDPKCPYHNFNHALSAVAVGKEICAKCKEEGAEVDENVVIAALLFHDAGYHENHTEKGFSSKEEYSAFLAEDMLKKNGWSEEFALKVARAIMGTKHDSSFVTNEKKLVRAADLSGLAGTYESFLENNARLKKEAEIFSGRKMSWNEWKENSKAIISFYLGQDIRLTSAYEDKDGSSIFHKRAGENLKRLLEESEKFLETQ